MIEFFRSNKNILFFLSSNLFSSIAISVGMYVIPWFISNGDDRPALLAIIAALSSAFILLITPFIGKIIDRYNRKTILLIINGFIAAAFFLVYLSQVFHGYHVYYLLLTYLIIQSYYAVFYITRQAFIKDIFSGADIYRVNSYLEMESQASTLIAAVAVILLSGFLGSKVLFLLLSLMIFLSFATLLVIPYVKSETQISFSASKLPDGFIKSDIGLFMMMGAIPFICMMVINTLLAPYLNFVLNQSIQLYATFGMVYGIGALLAGFILSQLGDKFSYKNLTLIFTSGFALVLLTIFIIPGALTIILGSFFLGLFNSASRISSQNLVLKALPTEVLGRAFSIGQFFTLSSRTLFVGIVPLIFSQSYHFAWAYVFAISGLAPLVLSFLVLKQK